MSVNFLWDVPDSRLYLSIPNTDIIRMYQNSGIIPLTVTCEKCGDKMDLVRWKKCIDEFKWKCRQQMRHHCPQRNIRSNTVLQYCKISLREIAFVFSCFVEGKLNPEIKKETAVSYCTILKLQKCFQRICYMLVYNEPIAAEVTVDHLRTAMQFIPNLSRSAVHQLRTAQRKAKILFPNNLLLHFWVKLGNLLNR